MKVEASAPSNIALIKYMGKTSTANNLPTNPSLSYTLEHLRSFVTLEESDRDYWEPLEGFQVLALAASGQARFLSHFANLKRHFGIHKNYLVRSANNFSADCGLASSASSFAALTLATAELAQRLGCWSGGDEIDARMELSRLARRGSGSSCRSLFSPWAVWQGEGAEPCPLALRLEHAVVMVADGKKLVSSSQAHARVASSLLFAGRPERARQRLQGLRQALSNGHWQDAFELCWSEFQDMHALFETANPAFGYMNAETMNVLRQLRAIWSSTEDGPLVTMDAGANVHLLLRPEQTVHADEWLRGFHYKKSWT